MGCRQQQQADGRPGRSAGDQAGAPDGAGASSCWSPCSRPSLVLAVLPPAQADDKKTIDAKVKAAQSQLENATQQVQAAAAALVAAQAGLPSAQQALTQASTDLAAAQSAEAEVVQRLAAAEAERAKAERAVAAVQERMAGTRQLIGRVARDVYTSGSAFAEWQVVLQSESPDDLVARIAGVQSVMRSQGSALDRLAPGSGRPRRGAGAPPAPPRTWSSRSAPPPRRAPPRWPPAAEAAGRPRHRSTPWCSQRDSALASAESQRAAELKRLQELQAEQKRVAAASRPRAGARRVGQGHRPADLADRRVHLGPGRAAHPPGLRVPLLPHRHRHRRAVRPADQGRRRRHRGLGVEQRPPTAT